MHLGKQWGENWPLTLQFEISRVYGQVQYDIYSNTRYRHTFGASNMSAHNATMLAHSKGLMWGFRKYSFQMEFVLHRPAESGLSTAV